MSGLRFEFDHALAVADGIALPLKCRVLVEPRSNSISGFQMSEIEIRCPNTGVWRPAINGAWADIYAAVVDKHWRTIVEKLTPQNPDRLAKKSM